jgi:hypothetical protein
MAASFSAMAQSFSATAQSFAAIAQLFRLMAASLSVIAQLFRLAAASLSVKAQSFSVIAQLFRSHPDNAIAGAQLPSASMESFVVIEQLQICSRHNLICSIHNVSVIAAYQSCSPYIKPDTETLGSGRRTFIQPVLTPLMAGGDLFMGGVHQPLPPPLHPYIFEFHNNPTLLFPEHC